MSETNFLPPVYSLEFKFLDSVISQKDFTVASLEPLLDRIYDATDDIDSELDIDISDRDMYIMTTKIDAIEPIVRDILETSNYFDNSSFKLYPVYIDQDLYNTMGIIEAQDK